MALNGLQIVQPDTQTGTHEAGSTFDHQAAITADTLSTVHLKGVLSLYRPWPFT